MKLLNLLRTCLLVGAVCVCALYPSLSAADDSEVLKRLEKLEQEVRQLKKQNAELREALDSVDKDSETEKAKLREMVAKDRQEIDELKRSAGRLDRSGLRSVLGKYNMQIYGRVKVDYNYDTASIRRYNDGTGAIGRGDAENDSTNFNPRDSRLGLKVFSQDGQWLSEARIEADFYGTNAGNNLIPRLRLGYVKVTNTDWNTSLLMGQDWIPIARIHVPTIDFFGLAAGGNLWWRVPQITVRKDVGNFEFLGSAMKHRRISTEEEDRMPWLLGRIKYSNGILGKGGMIALGGGIKNGTTARNRFGRDNSVDRWLAALELELKRGRFTFRSESWIGEGLDNEWLRYDLGINTHDNRLRDRKRRPDTIRGRGGFVSLTYAATPKINFSAGYGLDDPDRGDMDGMQGFLNDRQFTKNETYFLNSWYSITPVVKLGWEIMYLETERFHDTNNGMRYTVSTIYNF